MERDENPTLSTHQKALRINLDAARYGTFAEIGAGQEVARWFFKVGGAAGTISKSISAYDIAVSDAIYGRSKRYVSRERLQSMLDHEHGLNLERLRPELFVGKRLNLWFFGVDFHDERLDALQLAVVCRADNFCQECVD